MGKYAAPTRRKGFKKGSLKRGRQATDVDRVYEAAVVGKFAEDRKQLSSTPVIDTDLPGLGQFYCPACARHFINEQSLADHLKVKSHKRRVKELQSGVVPYGVDAEETRGGKKVDNGPGRGKQ